MSASALPSALVNSIENGAYPDSEDIVSSEVKADSLRSSLELVKREKGTLEVFLDQKFFKIFAELFAQG